MGIVEEIMDFSDTVYNERTLEMIFVKLHEEVSELGTEVGIVEGVLKPDLGGDDGIIGEAVDCIICLVDLIHKYDPSMTEEKLKEIANRKLEKWKCLYS